MAGTEIARRVGLHRVPPPPPMPADLSPASVAPPPPPPAPVHDLLQPEVRSLQSSPFVLQPPIFVL
ncbi:hypothetical protein JYU34_016811 [Plutella xylostella]|uniref:Uncharacterized protein n=1 Tax=Plutella xylostella TaxID=51655 RepID=A0ABQ7Q3I9_PLUXY|nr:hypothetical protein JYU34_016811 [Plutella xylostella]